MFSFGFFLLLRKSTDLLFLVQTGAFLDFSF